MLKKTVFAIGTATIITVMAFAVPTHPAQAQGISLGFGDVGVEFGDGVELDVDEDDEWPVGDDDDDDDD